MAKLREANTKNSQYATAMGHLQHIYKINATIEKTHEYIQDGKLLLAHKKSVILFHETVNNCQGKLDSVELVFVIPSLNELYMVYCIKWHTKVYFFWRK